MSYIAFDLDALNVCPQVGAACGMNAEQACYGLAQLWAWCFRTEQATVTDIHLRGFFQGKDAGPALEAFGFTERDGEAWRVRGAARYLRIKEAQREGGKKGARNLRRGKKKASPDAPKPEHHPEVDPRVYLGSTSSSTSSASPALTPSTEHRAPSKRSQSAQKPRTPDPRFGPLVGELKKLQPTFTDADGSALKTLLARGEAPEEILRRFERGLTADRFSPKCASVLQLLQRWPELGIVRDGKATAGPPALRATAPGPTCAACGRPAEAGLTSDVPGCYPCISAFNAWCDSTAQPEPWAVARQWAAEQLAGLEVVA